MAGRELCEQLLEHLNFGGAERGPAMLLDVVANSGREFLFKESVRVNESPPQCCGSQFSDEGLSQATHSDNDHGGGCILLIRSMFGSRVELDALNLEANLQVLSKRR
jgi:hypothetical protein